MNKNIAFIVTLLYSSVLFAQQTYPLPENEVHFKASWIAPPQVSLTTYGVYHFRKKLDLASKPESFSIRISADNRYLLYVNGIAVLSGPQRSDLTHWKYDTLDIASYLHKGSNSIAIQVWNQGEGMAWAQLSLQTGLWVEGIGTASIINTDTTWKVIKNQAYRPLISELHITGPFDHITAEKYPWGWQDPDYADDTWMSAIETEKAIPIHHSNTSGRQLSPRNIPIMEEKQQTFAHIRRAEGIAVDDRFLRGNHPLYLSSQQKGTLLIDQGVLTTAYPQLVVSGGKGCTITVTYSEALYADMDGGKGNRNETEGKHSKGDKDIFILDGGDNRLFCPLYYRTFRYVELKIENAKFPLTIHTYNSRFTAYPFMEKASFTSSDTSLDTIWEVGWRTSRLCAFETYMDCPYYEQMQYIGDTRIQALISLYVSGDDRLMKNAIEQFDQSRIPEGLTQSRYPSGKKQIIPPFSLFWIAMLHDYWMLGSDPDFVKRFLPAVEEILQWHARYVNQQHMLTRMPYWNFVDWPKEWPWKGDENISGIPSGALEGNSAILTLQYVYALQKASDLYYAFGKNEEAKRLEQLEEKIRITTYKTCWDQTKGMMADTPEKTAFSQHVNALAVLTGTIPQKDEKNVLLQIEKDTSIIQCTLYYRFYLVQAFKKAGLGNEYLRLLTPWYHMIDLGLTTFAERPEPTRSDCHGWSASPTYDLLATVCGIEPTQPGFKSVRITPNFGNLKWIQASMPHPKGTIALRLEKKGKQLKGEIALPQGVEGVLVWQSKPLALKGGSQKIQLDGN
ncbi:family 78 glycoside hydrolase catalytic domain [Cytophagaceae bacterium DM2B3-1]|uniref:Family 78 glycoside hydrolase catalytic domain n=1 Tax=Xanthocytophaga flava TaxID=3048013 RepID=A0ABT7CX54_9BACT|nr:family 78 glycoside hydrolase catalytic domain [Xanthocytophaga flavus]MDJ1498317.1 family 78 glycoside hydrolase catalytic domain [Xanthocytophaga flavus]